VLAPVFGRLLCESRRPFNRQIRGWAGNGGFALHIGIGKHYWILTVIGGALVVSMAAWIIRRRRSHPS